MRRPLSLILTLTAWLLATGSHWDLVQTFAWGRMLATNAQSMSFLAAAQRTFTPEGMCAICHAVADAKQKESAADSTTPGSSGKSLGKIPLVFAPADAPLVIASVTFRWSPNDQLICTADRAAPPLPPPRALA